MVYYLIIISPPINLFPSRLFPPEDVPIPGSQLHLPLIRLYQGEGRFQVHVCHDDGYDFITC